MDFIEHLDQIFHAPFRQDGPLGFNNSKHFGYAYTHDSAFGGEELAKAAIAQRFNWNKIILTAANDGKVTPTSISERQAMRLVQMEPQLRGRILLARRDKQAAHSGEECKRTLEILQNEHDVAIDGKYNTLAITRPFHALRSYLIAVKQTPELRSTYLTGEYAGYEINRDQLGWAKNPEYCDWICSELGRVLAYSYNIDADKSEPGALVPFGSNAEPLANTITLPVVVEPQHLLQLYKEMTLHTDTLMAENACGAQPTIQRGFFARPAPKPGVHNQTDARVDQIFSDDIAKFGQLDAVGVQTMINKAIYLTPSVKRPIPAVRKPSLG